MGFSPLSNCLLCFSLELALAGKCQLNDFAVLISGVRWKVATRQHGTEIALPLV